MRRDRICFLAFVLFSFEILPTGRADVLLRDEFKNLDSWDVYDYKTVGEGQKSLWQVSDGKVFNAREIRNTDDDRKITGGVNFGTDLVTKRSFKNSRFRLVVRELDYQVFYGLLFRYADERNYYRLDFNTDMSSLIVMKDGKMTKVPLPDNFCYVLSKLPTTVDLVCDGPDFAVYINGYKRLAFHDATFSSGKFGFFTVQNKGVCFSDVSISSDLQPVADIKLAISKKPYLFWCTGAEARVAWETNVPGKQSSVEYGVNGKFDHRVEAKTNVLVHQAILSGLEAGKRYQYRCFTDGLVAGSGEFLADPGLGKPVVFGLLGDSQYSPATLTKLTAMMMSHHPNLLLHVGDAIDYGTRSNWDYELFTPNEPVISTTPYFGAIGNHELNSKYFSYFLPYPDTNNKRGHYYAARYGCVAFAAFDDFHLTGKTVQPSLGEKPVTNAEIVDEQLKWLEETLASPMFQQADWRIVYSHKPPYCVGWDTYPGEVWKRGDKFMGLLKKYHVNFLFNGHTHTLERGMIDDVCTIITGGVAQQDNWGRAWDHVDVYSYDRHFGLFEMTPKRAVITFTNLDGKVIDRLVLEKGKSYYLAETPTLIKHPEAKASGKLVYLVSTPSLGQKLLKYKISYDSAIDTYQWTTPAAATTPVMLSIEPKPGKYRVRIVGMDEDGHVTRPVFHDVEVVK